MEDSYNTWYPCPHVSGIGVAAFLCIAKCGIDYFHLVRRTCYMSTPTQESLSNVPFTDEAATKWYMQIVVSEDSDFEGPANLFDDYDNVSDFGIPNMSTDDENTQR